ncbi:RHS repeat domain-containing protein [Microbacterium rhizomatis]|uniref:RHS repeat protein n=1 Tax=Microbacterium rhizomatis TaxID=1631477 RepID=A0A5J5J468_9MICO|nr:RHS repeat domain-containing protein [Microbacterium rhizomatis]KAA9108270.1 RHS repeat protein [Microbacterium rhizomatis]
MGCHVQGAGRAGLGVVLAVCVVLAGSTVSASAADGGGGSGSVSPVVGGFGLGDGVEGLIDERVGSLSLDLLTAGLGLRWDSRAVGADRVGFGAGWVIAGLGDVEVIGGVKVHPASGRVYDADASAPSGMAGYLLGDVVFSQTGGMLPGRPDGLVGDREYGFVLSQTGGTIGYFSATGDPLTQVDGLGNRSDWDFAPDGSHRLVRMVDTVGVVTRVDWSDPPAARVTRAAGASAGAAVVSGVVELDGGQVTAVVDAVGGRVTVGYDPRGLISRIAGVSGAVDEVSWQTLADGSTAVDRVRVVDGLTGAVLSEREWDALSGEASGWPTYAGEGDVFSSGDSGFRYRTVLSDGATRVISEYNSTHLLIDRSVEVTTANGPVVLQEQTFEYPETAGGTVPAPWALPEQFNRPTHTNVVFRDGAGRERITSGEYAFDRYGKVTSQTSADGTITDTVYDDSVATGAALPVGLPLSETVTTKDGLVSQTRYEMNGERTAPVAVETFSGTTTGELSRTGRVEYTVQADGFISAERVFGQGGAGTRVVTTHRKDVDLDAGTTTLVDTVAAGTDLAVSTSRVTDLLTGQTVSQTDSVGNTVTNSYDAAGRVTGQTDAAGNTTATRHLTMQDDGVNATVVASPDGVVTTTEADVLGRVVKVTDNLKDGSPVEGFIRVVESRAHPDPGTVKITDAWGAVTVTKQDVFGREIETAASTGLTKITRYDDVAHTVTTGLSPTGNIADAEQTTTQVLDAAGRVAQTSGTRADARPVPTITSTFDGLGRQSATTDGTIRTEVQRDLFGNPTTTVTKAGSGLPLVAARQFDQFGTSVEKTLREGDQSRSGGTRTLNVRGEILSETDQNGSATTYQYTPDGLVAKAVTGYGQVTTNTYDAVTRALVETVTTSPIGEQVRTGFQNDPVSGNLLAVFDPADRAGTEITFTYDAFRNSTSTTYPDGKRLTHTYDGNGRKATTTDIAGNTTSYTYDRAGLLTSAAQTDAAGAEIGAVRYEYDAFARVSELSRGNGVSTRYTYTSSDQIATETTTGPDGSAQDARAYTYDTRGNLTSRTDTITDLDPVEGAAATTSTVTAYEYDGRDRLTRSTVRNGDTADAPVASETSYLVTVSGDIFQETVTTSDPDTGAKATTVREFGYTPTGEIATLTTTAPDGSTATVAPTYDAAGNLTDAIDGTHYTYNAANQPVRETSPTGESITTGYWATGQRAQLSSTDAVNVSGRAQFYWDDTTMVNDTHTLDNTPTGTASYLIGATRHARTTTTSPASASTRYYTQDRHGNTTALTAEDGAPTTRYTYTDYGTPTTTSTDPGAGAREGWVGNPSYQPFQYAGEHTTPTGRQHHQARTYDPATTRFTTKDSAKLHNTYNYANLNPIMMIDPTGNTAELGELFDATMLGAGILLVMFTVGAAIFTEGASLGAMGIVSLIADAATTGVAATLVAHQFNSLELAPETVRGLRVVEAVVGFATIGLGVAVAKSSLTTIAKVIDDVQQDRRLMRQAFRVLEPDAFVRYADQDITESMVRSASSQSGNGLPKEITEKIRDLARLTMAQLRSLAKARLIVAQYAKTYETTGSLGMRLPRSWLSKLGSVKLPAQLRLSPFLRTFSDDATEAWERVEQEILRRTKGRRYGADPTDVSINSGSSRASEDAF